MGQIPYSFEANSCPSGGLPTRRSTLIISHKHKYLFVELPQTGTSAISEELCKYYDGMRILKKHATYQDFLNAIPEGKDYFVFSCIRNPLDKIVSTFLKIKTNHKGKYDNPIYWSRNGGFISDRRIKAFNLLKGTDFGFSIYFKKFYIFPYDDMSCLSHKQFDFIIRFENIQHDFSELLELLGLQQIRQLPVVNRTSEKEKDYLSYYTPDMYKRVVRIFGPYMQKWDYDFPATWGRHSIPWYSRFLFETLCIVRRHFRWSSAAYAQVLNNIWSKFLYWFLSWGIYERATQHNTKHDRC